MLLALYYIHVIKDWIMRHRWVYTLPIPAPAVQPLKHALCKCCFRNTELSSGGWARSCICSPSKTCCFRTGVWNSGGCACSCCCSPSTTIPSFPSPSHHSHSWSVLDTSSYLIDQFREAGTIPPKLVLHFKIQAKNYNYLQLLNCCTYVQKKRKYPRGHRCCY